MGETMSLEWFRRHGTTVLIVIIIILLLLDQ